MYRKAILFLAVMLPVSLTAFAQEADQRKRMRVVGFQMEVSTDIEQNEKRILHAIGHTKKEKADFLITPEGSLSGYNATFDRQDLHAALRNVTETAREAGIGLIPGTCYKEVRDGKEQCWNQVRVYAPGGEHLGNYSKILRCSPVDLPGTGEMQRFVEGTVRTFEWRGLRFGTLICNDLWATPGYTTMPNPYLPLKLKQQGADAIFHVINSGVNQKYRPFHESSVELWALSLKLPIVEVNASKVDRPVNARSGLVDKTGNRAVEVDDTGEQFFTYDLDFE